jgi:multiple sugar transport system ATP-binding protein
MASLSLQHLQKVYESGNCAVEDFNIEIQDGEFIVLVGPSGCGKSTTLRMIAGLEGITKGKLLIGDDDCTEKAAKDRDIAMVFQNYALYASMSVYQNMGFSLMLRKEDPEKIHHLVMDAAHILGLEQQLNKKPRELSGGQRQRVAMGRAIVRNPKVFLFDEPLSNLDAKLRSSMRREIKLLHHRLGTTMIYVTHDQTEALTLPPTERTLAAKPSGSSRPLTRRFAGGMSGRPFWSIPARLSRVATRCACAAPDACATMSARTCRTS